MRDLPMHPPQASPRLTMEPGASAISRSGVTAPAASDSIGRLISAGREADVFLLDDSTVFRVDKSEWSSSAGRSTVALRAAAGQGAPVPEIYGTAKIDGRLGVAMERLDSRHLLHLLGDAPWRVVQVGRIMGSVHAALHNIPGPAALPTTYECILLRMAQSDLLESRRRGLPDSWRMIPAENRLLHGDFNPANLLRRPCTGEWLAVDWAGASRGDPAADVAYTLALIARGVPPATASRLSKVAAPAGRLLLASAYLAEYLRHRQLDLGAVGRWFSLWIAIRAAERSAASHVLYGCEGPMSTTLARSRW